MGLGSRDSGSGDLNPRARNLDSGGQGPKWGHLDPQSVVRAYQTAHLRASKDPRSVASLYQTPHLRVSGPQIRVIRSLRVLRYLYTFARARDRE
jgi:hypothetical protein